MAAAAMQMWDGNCGTLPVVDDGGKVIGMITDRNICIAAATTESGASPSWPITTGLSASSRRPMSRRVSISLRRLPRWSRKSLRLGRRVVSRR
ncbi:MAG: hypothetical protein DMF64_16590 [Acidobacteria bacterium]|nr:MAG: hypothetical protein DMF64_16590 [Acidobacteriota bacterium]